MKLQSNIHNLLNVLLYLIGEASLSDVAREDVLVDSLQGLLARETDGKHTRKEREDVCELRLHGK